MIRRSLVFVKSVASRDSDGGQALVELALWLPLMAIMMLGAAELARVAYAAIEVSNAAHAAAQYAASSHAASGNFGVSAGAYSGGISNAASGDSDLSGTSGIKVTNVLISCSCADTSYTPSSCSDNKTCTNNHTAMIQTVMVETQTSFKPLIKIPFLPSYTDSNGAIKLTGSSSQVVTNQ